MGEGSHLAVLVSAEHFAQGAGGHLAVQAVDVDAFLIVLLTHGLLRLFLWPGGR